MWRRRALRADSSQMVKENMRRGLYRRRFQPEAARMSLVTKLQKLLADPAFGRSAVTSALATASDFLLASSLSLWHFPAGLATFLGCVAGGLIAFRVNRGWAFRAGGTKAGPQLARFLFVWAASAGLNAAGVALVVLLPAVGFGLAWITVRALVYTMWNYPMLKLFVFARPRPVP